MKWLGRYRHTVKDPNHRSFLETQHISFQGPVLQSIVSLTSALVVKLLTVQISTISNSPVILLKKIWVTLANAKPTHILQRKYEQIRVMIKVLTIRLLTTSLVLNNWAQVFKIYLNIAVTLLQIHISRAIRKRVLGRMRTAKAQIILCGCLCSPLTESLDTIKYISMESKCPGYLCILRMLEDTFMLGAAHMNIAATSLQIHITTIAWRRCCVPLSRIVTVYFWWTIQKNSCVHEYFAIVTCQ